MMAARALLAVAALAAAASLAGWLYRRAVPSEAPQPRPQAAVPPELDTRELKILTFYATRYPERGQPFTICYGVVNATRVEMEPPLAKLFPSISRCVAVTIHADTRFTLRAYDKTGRSASASFDLPVREPPKTPSAAGAPPQGPEILFVEVSDRQLRRGERFTLCYGVRAAARVRVEPGAMDMPAAEKHCQTWFPVQAPQKLIAESPEGRTEIELPVRLIDSR